MFESYHEEDFEKNFKQTCAGCGEKNPTDWESYKLRGNYCPACAGGYNHILRERELEEWYARREAMAGTGRG